MSRSRSIDDVKVNQKIDWFKMIDKGDATEVSLAVQYIQIARECLSRRHEEYQVLLYVTSCDQSNMLQPLLFFPESDGRPPHTMLFDRIANGTLPKPFTPASF
ncbi:hypothetical protein ACHAXH_000745 [Discostella pseudostelligera]